MKKKWKQSEDRTASNFGRKIPGSGAGNEKMDILGEGVYQGYRIENKFTENKSRSISLEELNKARNQALAMNSEPLFLIDFDLKDRYILISESGFINIMDEMSDVKSELVKAKEEIESMFWEIKDLQESSGW